jgi:hypothetical protein
MGWERQAGKAGRLALAGVLCLGLAAILANNAALAYNAYQDAWITLSARPLGMGGALAAVPDPASVFYNPAGLAGLRHLTLMFNHSGRHFPGVEDKRAHRHRADQLDSDTECIAVPLPGATFAHGFSFRGEYGYDYRPLDPAQTYGYPRDNVNGGEEYDALAVSGGLPLALGYSLRRQFLRFTPDPTRGAAPGAAPTGGTGAAAARVPAWLRVGQGEQWGLLAHVAPGLDYGRSEGKLNFDWTLLEPSSQADEGFAELHSKQKTKRSGLALHPCAWLTLASDSVHEDYLYPDKPAPGAPPASSMADMPGLGTVHHGSDSADRLYSGGELCLGQLARLRWGNYDGSRTVGFGFNLCGLWLNYAEAQGLLPKLIGSGDSFKDVHIYGGQL